MLTLNFLFYALKGKSQCTYCRDYNTSRGKTYTEFGKKIQLLNNVREEAVHCKTTCTAY